MVPGRHGLFQGKNPTPQGAGLGWEESQGAIGPVMPPHLPGLSYFSSLVISSLPSTTEALPWDGAFITVFPASLAGLPNRTALQHPAVP